MGGGGRCDVHDGVCVRVEGEWVHDGRHAQHAPEAAGSALVTSSTRDPPAASEASLNMGGPLPPFPLPLPLASPPSTCAAAAGRRRTWCRASQAVELPLGPSSICSSGLHAISSPLSVGPPSASAPAGRAAGGCMIAQARGGGGGACAGGWLWGRGGHAPRRAGGRAGAWGLGCMHTWGRFQQDLDVCLLHPQVDLHGPPDGLHGRHAHGASLRCSACASPWRLSDLVAAAAQCCSGCAPTAPPAPRRQCSPAHRAACLLRHVRQPLQGGAIAQAGCCLLSLAGGALAGECALLLRRAPGRERLLGRRGGASPAGSARGGGFPSLTHGAHAPAPLDPAWQGGGDRAVSIRRLCDRGEGARKSAVP